VRFERRAVGHGNIESGDAADARFEFVEAALSDARGDLRGDAAALVRFVGDDDAMGFFDL